MRHDGIMVPIRLRSTEDKFVARSRRQWRAPRIIIQNANGYKIPLAACGRHSQPRKSKYQSEHHHTRLRLWPKATP